RQETLVILRRRQADEPATIREREDGNLLALHELLDEQLAAGDAEAPLNEHRVDCAVGFGDSLTNYDALAGGETGRLDDHRGAKLACRAASALDVGARQGARRRNAGVEHQLLREGFRRFDLGGIASRPEDRELVGAES